MGAAMAASPQRHAVLIGINDYADPAIPALKYAESDAKAGVFTHFLVVGLRGAADTNADGVVTFEEQSTV